MVTYPYFQLAIVLETADVHLFNRPGDIDGRQLFFEGILFQFHRVHHFRELALERNKGSLRMSLHCQYPQKNYTCYPLHGFKNKE